MSDVLQDLSTGNSQVVVTTHSPLFIPSRSLSSVRLVRKDVARSEASVASVPMDRLAQTLSSARDEDPPWVPQGILAKIHQALQPGLNEIFFTPHLVLVEGREDAAHILAYLHLMQKADDLRRVGCHVVAADRKSSLLLPLAIVKELGIPTFLMFDADAKAPDRDGVREMHRKDNLALLRLAGVPDPNPLPQTTFWDDHVVMWCTELGTEIEADFPPDEWQRLSREIEARFGHIGGLLKNPLFIAERLEAAWNRGFQSRQLQDVCKRILAFCGVA